MFKRPIVTIAILYALLIILLRPMIPVPERPNFNTDKKEIPAISAINEKFMDVIKKTTPAPYDALLGSIVFGTNVSPLDTGLKDRYKKVGLAHLLVASGTQISILIGVCLAMIRYFKIKMGIGVVAVSIVNILFTITTGCGPSMVRAAVMGEIALIGLLFDRESEIYTSLALSALVLFIVDPLNLFDLGFQLSFSATWALVYFCPVLEEKGIPSIICVSLAPILATLPISLYNFNQISIVSLLVNILVVPWIEFLTIAGFVSTFFGVFFLPIAAIMNFLLYIALKFLNGIVYTFSGLTFSCVYLKQPWFPFVIIYYAGLICFAERLKGKRVFKLNKENIILIGLLFVGLFTWNIAVSPSSAFAQNDLQISVIDVKQGDSIFIKSPSGKTMLIDGGPKFRNIDAGKKYIIPFLRKLGVNKLDIVVLTHSHEDHVGGLPAVLSEIPVGLVMDPGQAHTAKEYIEFLKLIDEKNIPYKAARAGDDFHLEELVTCEVLGPTNQFIEKSAFNNNSIVIRLSYKDFSMMLMGDCEKEGEEMILGKYSFIKPVNVLKVGHHGSNTASSIAFLNAIKPQDAIISVGAKNRYFHPHPSTLKKFEEIGTNVYRTDLNGTVTVDTDGEEYHIKSEK
ncbi:DNA internalization-related competence protein ComEC/Rec2 [Candidatus Saganbacteria bacterium]|nr:DNA internalization-related competence protein ComEC/Rec2 [Candidatus Saganbacteria bacterium]